METPSWPGTKYMKPCSTEFGHIIRKKRIEKKMSLETLGDVIGVTKQDISHIESGRIKLCTADNTLVRLAKALDLDIDLLRNLREKRKIKSTRSSDPLGQLIIASRNRRGLSQQDLSILVGICNSYMSNIEQGRFKPTSKILSRLSEILGQDEMTVGIVS